jgi:hypothetical protein
VHTNKKSDSMELSGEHKLGVAVLRLAMRDLSDPSPKIRAPALAFWRGHKGSMRLWCDTLDLDAGTIQRWVMSGESAP